MRRAILAVTGLAASTTLLVVLKGSPGASQVAQSVPAEPPPVAPAPAGAPPNATPGPTISGAGPSGAPAGDAESDALPDLRAPSHHGPPRRPGTTSAEDDHGRTVTGPVVENRYGNDQVRITLSGTRIVKAVALELPQERAQSTLRSDKVDAAYSGTSGQVVQRQSANLDTVSGATYTSNSYKQSLQAAIDKAR
jgi:uncharacterized protein with FMN-binding domain